MFDVNLPPVEENPTLIQEKLDEFHTELNKLIAEVEAKKEQDLNASNTASAATAEDGGDGKDKEKVLSSLPAYYQAHIKCSKGDDSTVINDEFILIFLRSEMFVVKDTIELWINYWEKRLEIFGSVNAYKPITMDTKDGALYDVKDTVVEILKGCNVQILGNGVYDLKNERGIIGLQLNGSVLSKYDPSIVLQTVWYIGSVALQEDFNVQTRGIVVLIQPMFGSLSEFRNTPLQQISNSLQMVFPLNVCVCHMIHPPFIFSMLFKLIKLILGKRLSDRVIVHNGSDALGKLSKAEYGFDKSINIPSIFGGDVTTNKLFLSSQSQLNSTSTTTGEELEEQTMLETTLGTAIKAQA